MGIKAYMVCGIFLFERMMIQDAGFRMHGGVSSKKSRETAHGIYASLRCSKQQNDHWTRMTQMYTDENRIEHGAKRIAKAAKIKNVTSDSSVQGLLRFLLS